MPFVGKMTELEAALRAAGHDAWASFMLGGGSHENNSTVRPSYGESGQVIDEAFSGAAWMSIWSAAMALVDEVVTTTTPSGRAADS